MGVHGLTKEDNRGRKFVIFVFFILGTKSDLMRARTVVIAHMEIVCVDAKFCTTPHADFLLCMLTLLLLMMDQLGPNIMSELNL